MRVTAGGNAWSSQQGALEGPGKSWGDRSIYLPQTLKAPQRHAWSDQLLKVSIQAYKIWRAILPWEPYDSTFLSFLTHCFHTWQHAIFKRGWVGLPFGGPVVKTPRSHWRGHGSDPPCHKAKKKKTEEENEKCIELNKTENTTYQLKKIFLKSGGGFALSPAHCEVWGLSFFTYKMRWLNRSKDCLPFISSYSCLPLKGFS